MVAFAHGENNFLERTTSHQLNLNGGAVEVPEVKYCEYSGRYSSA